MSNQGGGESRTAVPSTRPMGGMAQRDRRRKAVLTFGRTRRRPPQTAGRPLQRDVSVGAGRLLLVSLVASIECPGMLNRLHPTIPAYIASINSEVAALGSAGSYPLLLGQPAVVLAQRGQPAGLAPHRGVPHVRRIDGDD